MCKVALVALVLTVLLGNVLLAEALKCVVCSNCTMLTCSSNSNLQDCQGTCYTAVLNNTVVSRGCLTPNVTNITCMTTTAATMATTATPGLANSTGSGDTTSAVTSAATSTMAATSTVTAAGSTGQPTSSAVTAVCCLTSVCSAPTGVTADAQLPTACSSSAAAALLPGWLVVAVSLSLLALLTQSGSSSAGQCP